MCNCNQELAKIHSGQDGSYPCEECQIIRTIEKMKAELVSLNQEYERLMGKPDRHLELIKGGKE